MSLKPLSIKGRQIGPDQPVFVIAEAGPNHNGDPELAKRLADAAKAAGADAVKFQTGDPRNIMSDATPKAAYQRQTTGDNGTMMDMIRKIVLTFEQFRAVKAHCDKIGILFLSTPFDLQSVDFLVSLGMPAIKIPSGEVTNPFLLRRVASKRLPVLLSTGMSWMSEIAAAIEMLRAHGSGPIGLFQCVSNYPAAPEGMNLRALAAMEQVFGVPCGFSDHSLGIDLTIAAVAMGASLIEKHFTLDRAFPGPDHAMSLEPDELEAMITAIRRVERARGDGVKQPQPAEFDVRAVARRSLTAARDIPKGTIVVFEDFFALRPASGIPPMLVDTFVGRRATHDIPARALITPQDFD